MTCARFVALACLILSLAFVPARADEKPATTEQDRRRLERFEKQVDEIRTLLRIPGMSAVIVRNQQVIWSKGFGYADVENKVPATPQTLYHVASLTKTFASTLVMQLVEQGKLDLDEPVSRYTTEVRGDSVHIKHLLSHTSEGTPGEHYSYNGNRYALLTPVLEKKTGKTFRALMMETFLDPLGMTASVPGHDVLDAAGATLDQEHRERYRQDLGKLAKPYTLYGSEILGVEYPPRDIQAAAGLLSTVLDLARYDAAIDRHQLLKPETQERAWTPFVSIHGDSLPYGYGWFVQSYQGERLIWHYGQLNYSATYLKLPVRGLTLLMLGNSEALSDPFYGDGGMETNAFASVFLRLFVMEDRLGRTLPDPDWSRGNREFDEQVKRLSARTGGKGYENTTATHALLTHWLENRRKSARVTMKVDPKTYDEYLGRYQLESKRRTFIAKREGNRFIIDFDRGEIAEVFPEAKDHYFTKSWDSQITFGRDSTGKVTYMDVVVEGRPALRANRIQ